LVSEMSHRVSTKPLDKVAGLVNLLRTGSIPIYNTKQSAADAWDVLVDLMDPWFRVQLLFMCSEPGNRSKYWRPSWEQVMTNKAIARHFTWYLGIVRRTNNPDADCYMGCCIKSGHVWGLGEVSKKQTLRQGQVVFNDANGASHTLKIADHAYPIPNGRYTLLGCSGIHSNLDLWVVGQIRQDGRFKKLSVFRSADEEKVELYYLPLIRQVKTLLC
ncbi:hypothetical protein IW261DRAFT_1348527, partial [Armillaria novae-zelandiae]